MVKRAFPPSPKVAERLGIILEYHGVTQKELAGKVGVTPSAVSQWLSCTSALSELNAYKIAEALGEDVEFVLGRSDRGSKGLGRVTGSLLAIIGPKRAKECYDIGNANPDGFRRALDLIIEAYRDKPKVQRTQRRPK